MHAYIIHTHTYREKGRELYYEELAHVIREADKSPDLHSAR